MFSALFFSSCNKEKNPDAVINEQFVENRITCPTASIIGCTFVPISATIDYEGCILTANASFYICNNSVVMVLGAPVWTYANSIACTKLKKKMSDLYNTLYIGDQLALDLYNVIHKKVVDAPQLAFLDWSEEHNGPAIYPCNPSPDWPCAGINGNMAISVTISDCIGLCELGKDGEGTSLLGVVKCGEGCCKRENLFCFDQFTGAVCIGPSTLTLIKPCEPVPSQCAKQTKKCSSPCDRL